MPITPDEARAFSDEEHETLRQLDAALVAHVRAEYARGVVTHDGNMSGMALPKNVSLRVVKELEARWRHAGWQTRVTFDQREQEYILFVREAG